VPQPQDRTNYVIDNQRDAALSSLYFILLPSHSTRFECLPRPSSGVHKTAVTATGTRHEFGNIEIKSVKGSPWSTPETCRVTWQQNKIKTA
jgi:hypothetical protein